MARSAGVRAPSRSLCTAICFNSSRATKRRAPSLARRGMKRRPTHSSDFQDRPENDRGYLENTGQGRQGAKWKSAEEQTSAGPRARKDRSEAQSRWPRKIRRIQRTKRATSSAGAIRRMSAMFVTSRTVMSRRSGCFVNRSRRMADGLSLFDVIPEPHRIDREQSCFDPGRRRTRPSRQQRIAKA